METNRLVIRPMTGSDQNAFLEGIADRALRLSYGFPEDMDETVPPEIFRHFRELPLSCSLIEKASGNMVGFLLDVEAELPESIAEALEGQGRTLAFAVFPAYQRQGYMEEALNAYIPLRFRDPALSYIHCGHFADNEPSRRLLQKVGFQVYAKHRVRGRIIIDQIRQR